MQQQALQTVTYDHLNELTKLQEHQEFLLKLLTSKDSFIRKKIIDQNLSYLNSRLTHYLDRIGLPHTVTFQSDLTVMIEELGLDDSSSFTKQTTDTSNFAKNDTFTNQIKKIQPAEIEALKFNLEQIVASDSANKVITNSKRQIERIVWARINKTDQRLYLYVDGQIVDTFKVSTGDKKHETPLMDRQPAGPIFQKYTSKKYPGGNYNGLGNMPHVVFVQGGYGIHGTTRGNIPRLGKKASHGCIRLHPDNAKIFNELVRKVGLNNTWVTIEN
jgi:lipoprotein-anchoring transpeptidase ErfK/SrfK